MQINRLFELVYILLDKKRATAGELAEHFGVSRRTICRDLDALSVAGIPIYTERGKGGGVSLLPDFVMNRTLFSQSEQTQLLSSLHGLSSIRCGDAAHLLGKLSALFKKSSPNWMEVEFAGWSYENDYFDAFREAICARRVVEFDYYNACGEKSRRRAEPVQVLFKSRAWYLKAFCLTKNDMRMYKVSRIKRLTVTEESFDLREIPPVSMAHDGAFACPLTKIVMRISPEMAHRVYDDFHESMAQKQPDGGFVVNVEWPVDAWLFGFILSFGRHMEVVSPESLRAAIIDEAEKISRLYS